MREQRRVKTGIIKNSAQRNSSLSAFKSIQWQTLTEMAEMFNGFFQSLFSEKENRNSESLTVECTHTDCLRKLLVTEGIHSVLEKLKSNKTTGHDGMSPSILKNLSRAIRKPLCLIFKTCLKRVFPAKWKYDNSATVHKTRLTVKSALKITDQSSSSLLLQKFSRTCL